MTPALLSVKEVAARMGVSYNTVRKWISEGRLKAHRYCDRVLSIHEHDLAVFIESNAVDVNAKVHK